MSALQRLSLPVPRYLAANLKCGPRSFARHASTTPNLQQPNPMAGKKPGGWAYVKRHYLGDSAVSRNAARQNAARTLLQLQLLRSSS